MDSEHAEVNHELVLHEASSTYIIIGSCTQVPGQWTARLSVGDGYFRGHDLLLSVHATDPGNQKETPREDEESFRLDSLLWQKTVNYFIQLFSVYS